MTISATIKPATDRTHRAATPKVAPRTARLADTTKKAAQKPGERAGDSTDNPLHRRLFSLPPLITTSSAALTVPAPPKMQQITGDREVDAVLWLREVIGTGDAALIAKAQDAATKIRTPLETVEKRYKDHLRLAHPGNPFATLSSFGFAELDQLAERSIERSGRQVEALGRFGSKEALFHPTAAESFCVITLKGLEPQGQMYEIDAEQAATRFRRHPAELPQTLADCLHELLYWEQLAALRYAFGTCCGDPLHEVQARNDFVFVRLAEIPPRDRNEARRVLDYLYSNDRMERTETRAILANLIG